MLQLHVFEFLCRKCFKDLEFEDDEEENNNALVVDFSDLGFWCNFFNPRNSFHRLERLGALGENK